MEAAQECYRLGTQRFPDISWPWAEFAVAWSSAGEGRPGTAEEFLRLACLRGLPGAAAALDREFLRPLRPVLRRICRSEDLTDTALQELRTKLLLPPAPRLDSYKPTSSLRAWLSVVATRTALDVVRRSAVHERHEVELEEQLAAMTEQPEQRVLGAEQRALLAAALRAAVRRLPHEQRFALRMHVTANWNIAQIGRVFSVHRATVARWLLAAKEALRGTLREELERLAPGPADAALSSLPSQLDVSLSRVFATTGVHGIEEAPR
jgi:RNA polymerase sigma-70 factor (ECF subfamily)